MWGLTRGAVIAVILVTMTGCSLFGRHRGAPFAPVQPGTTLTGSQTGNADGSASDTIVYVVAIDGKFVDIGARDWTAKVGADPGMHEIRFGIARSQAELGFGTVTATLAPGIDYVLRASQPQTLSPQCSAALGWLETKDGRQASAQVSVVIPASVETETTLPDGGYKRSWRPAACPGG